MGVVASATVGLWGRVTRQKQVRILMLGLDAAGKTTLLRKMRLGEVVTTIPTIGFNVESLEHRLVSVISWDVGGRDKIRPLWRHYYQPCNCIVFVVDSSDRDRLVDAREELFKTLGEDELKDAPLLVFANKHDLPKAMTVADLTDKLGLSGLRHRAWHIQAVCATTGDGIYDGLKWLEAAFRGKPPPKGSTSPAPASSSPQLPEGPHKKSSASVADTESTADTEDEAQEAWQVGL